MKTVSPKTIARVTELFHSVSGIRLGEHKQALVIGRLQRLAQEAGVTDVEQYAEGVVRGGASSAEGVKLIDRLTTNETYFFREPEHFTDLASRAAASARNGEFLVWSAASSSGEEAYSVAMLLADLLGKRAWRVMGTDLSTAMVDSARRGLYPMERARLVSTDFLERFCLKGQGAYEGQLLIDKSLRERVEFLPANLMQALPSLPMFDVIFLRNVLIYFENDAKAEIVRRVLTQLKPTGVLYTGHAESLSMLRLPIRTLATAIHTHG
jgi:chemotaxis protein methyltransferase CheR